MKLLIIGDGSAGRRYERLAQARGHEVVVLGPKDYYMTATGHDGVIIASPPSSHQEYLRYFMGKNQRPILCEGPVTWCDPAYPCPNMTASNWRFVYSMQEFVARLADRQPVNAHLWFDYDLNLWRPGTPVHTSCYYREGITRINLHEVDMAMWMFGPAERVHVESRNTLKSMGMDAYSMIIKHHSGVLTTIQSGWHATKYQRGCIVQLRDGSREEIVWQSPQDDPQVNASYEAVLDTWLTAIENWDLSVTPSLEDGYRAWQAINRMAY
jgi:predicted dehydrogenase